MQKRVLRENVINVGFMYNIVFKSPYLYQIHIENIIELMQMSEQNR